MAIRRTMTGTSWHVEQFTRKEGDGRRHRSRCIHNNREDDYCSYVNGRCYGAAHCSRYKEGTKKDSINPYFIGKEDKQKLGIKDSVAKVRDNNSIKFEKLLRNKGTRVNHIKFGDGMVKKVENNKVTIRFDIGKEVKVDIEVCVKNNLLKIM